MKNYRDEKHKKLITLIVLFYLFGIAQYILVSIIGYDISTGLFFILQYAFIIMVALASPPPMAYFDNEVLIKGLLIKKTIYWSEVYKIELGYDYIKVDAGNFKHLTVKPHSFNYDPNLHERFLDIIKKLIDDEEVEVVYGQGYDPEKLKISRVKIDGWLVYFLLTFYASVLRAFTSLFFYIDVIIEELSVFTIIQGAVTLFILVYSIVLIIKYTKKKQGAVPLFKGYYWIHGLSNCIAGIRTILWPSGIFSQAGLPVFVLYGVLILISAVLLGLMMSEYANVSVRVRNTFVN